ncbi:MAG: sensor histidine kinase [Herbiconiux sp.]|nr:sensor histidine kinase [Herbiconiux sp.]
MTMPSATTGKIRFAPSILRRLGEELNPNIDQGILELVKNAYDADATECHIWLDGDGVPGTVVVQDNGDGMTAEQITSGWLVLGDSGKTTAKTTGLGRIPAGNKGLGRLAALRLGHEARMISTPLTGGRFEVILNWDIFDKARTVDDVSVEVLRTPADAVDHGTRIELSRLRESIGRVDARKLARALVLLADPFGDEPNGFKPVLHSEEFADIASQVTNRYFDQAEYHLRAQLRDGVPSAEVSDWRGNVLWRTESDSLDALGTKSGGSYAAPDSDFDLWIFILDAKEFTGRNVQLSAVRDWLRQFGGVHVYSNGLRVTPYGNPGDDWLSINLSRVRSPENRPGTNTSIGRLRIQDPAGTMVQKTDRSGFIESVAFEELTRFAQNSLEWLATRRQQESERRRQQNRKTTQTDAAQSSQTFQARIAQVVDESTKKQLETAFKEYDRARERENETLRKDLQLYRTLSTAGITAATFAHESTGSPLKSISIINNSLKSALAKDLPEKYQSKYGRRLDQISNAVDQLGVLSSATLDIVSEAKRRIGKVKLNEVIRNISDIFNPFLVGRKVDLALDLSGPGEPFLRGSEASLESIVTNLINNSLSAFERADVAKRQILVRTRVIDGAWEMTVADNGPGIVGIPVDDIWLPGQTQRPGGTGLGLTIVRDTLVDLGGSAEAIAQGELGGASFVVRLSTLGIDND